MLRMGQFLPRHVTAPNPTDRLNAVVACDDAVTRNQIFDQTFAFWRRYPSARSKTWWLKVGINLLDVLIGDFTNIIVVSIVKYNRTVLGIQWISVDLIATTTRCSTVKKNAVKVFATFTTVTTAKLRQSPSA